jgi:transcriptional regulator with XRE-family HTH domain
VTTNPTIPEIRKEAFTQAREKLGLSAKDLGGRACLSTRQIEQIESGEMSSFYGAQIKFTAAKKVAKLLQLSDGDAFNYGLQTQEQKNEPVAELPIAEVKVVDSSKAVQEEKAPTKTVDVKQDVVESNHQVLLKEVPFPSAAAQSKSNSRKKLFLGLSVAAAIVFSVINLRPIFVAGESEEIILVKEEIIEPAPAATPTEPAPSSPVTAPVPVVAAVSAEVSSACPAEEGIISYKPDAPRKVADMVYVEVKSKRVICVSDATGKMQNKVVEPGAGASFYGKPPFKVLTGSLAQVDVFFQGTKVRLSNPNVKTLILEASEVVAPSSGQTDSQLR